MVKASLSALLCITVTPAMAELRVATDIPPVYSLVAQVMGDRGQVDLIVPPGASPHGHALRPSDASALSSADLVVWIGEDLTPWLADPIEALAGDATHLELLAVEGTTVLPFREEVVFEHDDHEDHDDHDDHEGHDHDEEHADHEDHDEKHDDHEGHDHDEDHADHEDHDEEHADHEGHDHDEDHADHEGHDEEHAEDDGHDDHGHHHHGENDPHAWLSPDNGQVWLAAIAETLAAADPEGAEIYRANAASGAETLAALGAELSAKLAPLDASFIVYHDAYQYFEASFGLNALGSIAPSDAESPSAARIAELRDVVTDTGVACVFTEPQYSPRLAGTVLEGTGAKTGVVDPLGAAIPLGPELYAGVLNEIADGMVACLSD